MDKPWFVYTRWFYWWPCHWKGWLFAFAAFVTLAIAVPVLHALLEPAHKNLFVLAMLGIMGAFYIIGSRHAEPL